MPKNRHCTFHAQCIIFGCLSVSPVCLSVWLSLWKTFVFLVVVVFFFSWFLYKLIDIFTSFCRVLIVGGLLAVAQPTSQSQTQSTSHSHSHSRCQQLTLGCFTVSSFWVCAQRSKVIRYIFGQQQLIVTGCVCFYIQLPSVRGVPHSTVPHGKWPCFTYTLARGYEFIMLSAVEEIGSYKDYKGI